MPDRKPQEQCGGFAVYSYKGPGNTTYRRGKKEHLCIASSPDKNRCCYGIDLPVAADSAPIGPGLALLAEQVGADNVTFAEPSDLYCALGHDSGDYCTACS